ncbi:hypothetical protein DAPPUDRAFT_250129 [Daphnia pulex]|uniref:Uncharacterized protein n=1 Tax=Daphnia pulex TaxID=6669 RepID=E9GXZ3_DAPPU|nr:hypothetical protein DAPPUDRAFT_250129 [Daphnia pulex]|eukprot:EFX75647.1 hypothetical protein DAPPUDRAFT_250129 [Daphnia pulex]
MDIHQWKCFKHEKEVDKELNYGLRKKDNIDQNIVVFPEEKATFNEHHPSLFLNLEESVTLGLNVIGNRERSFLPAEADRTNYYNMKDGTYTAGVYVYGDSDNTTSDEETIPYADEEN